jgi:outer membrane lipoprotein SlyB
MADLQPRMNPLVVVASAAIIVFSAVGVGVMTGVIPSSFSRSAETASSAVSTVQPSTAAEPKKAASTEPARRPATREASKPAAAPAAQPAKPAQTAATPPATPAVCVDCGRIEAINVVEEKGEGSGLGAVAGGVVGGILGNQVGRGSGRKIATVAGVAGGAYAGHQIEKQAKATKRYEVTVRMDNGGARSVSYEGEPSFRLGDKVKIVNGMLVSG